MRNVISFTRFLLFFLVLSAFLGISGCKKAEIFNKTENTELTEEQLAEQKQLTLSKEEEIREEIKEKAAKDADLNFCNLLG